MPARTRIRSMKMLMVLAVAALPCIGPLPLASGQTDAPASGQPNADKKNNGVADKEPDKTSEVTEKATKGAAGANKKSAKRKAAEKASAAEAGAQKAGTEKGTRKQETEKRAAKAQRGSSAKPADGPRSSDAAGRKRAEVEREEAALALVREHHPALVELLERLKATKQADYQQAIKELYRDSQRLAAVRERDADRYALELRGWQLDSRIRLLTARLSLEDRIELQEELKACLTQRGAVRLSLKQLDRDRAAARAERLDAEIEKLTAGQEADVNRSFERLLRAAKKAAGGRQQGRKAADSARSQSAAKATGAPAAGDTHAVSPRATQNNGEPSPPLNPGAPGLASPGSRRTGKP